MKPKILFSSGLIAAHLTSSVIAEEFILNSRGTGTADNVQTVWITNGVTDAPTGAGGNHRLNDWGSSNTTNRFLLKFDLSSIKSTAAGRPIIVNHAVLQINRDWTSGGGWSSQSLHTAAGFTPATTTWSTGNALQEEYIGDVGGGGGGVMSWDSRYPGTNDWDRNVVALVPDVQGDLQYDRSSNYLLRVSPGNEWSAEAGIGAVSLTVDVTFGDISDLDSDTLPDAWEMTNFSNLDQGAAGDPDGDSFTNGAEFTAGSNPNSNVSVPSDTDGDGLLDTWEVTYFGGLGQGANGDPDNDGSFNSEEFAAGTLPNNATSQPDNDQDGLPDGWEFLSFTNLDEIANGDPDADTYSNLVEYQAGSSPLNPVSVPNDIDGDALPDVWEIANFGNLSKSGTDDSDNDGSINSLEFAASTNPTDATSQPDTDQDGLPDGWELKTFTNTDQTADGDPDLDTFSNLTEFSAGSNALSLASVPKDIDGDGIPNTWEGTWLAHGNQWGEAYNIDPRSGLIQGGTLVKASNLGDGACAVTVAGIAFDIDYSNTNYNDRWHPNDAPVRFDEDGDSNLETDAENLMNHRVNVYSWGGRRLTMALPNLVKGRSYRFQVLSSNADGGGYGVDFFHTAAGTSDWRDYAYSGMWNSSATGSLLRVFEWTTIHSSVVFEVGLNGGNWDNHDILGYAVTDISEDSDSDGLADKWELLHFGTLENAGSGDFDQDTFSNLSEHLGNSEPTRVSSTPYDTDADGMADTWENESFGNLFQSSAMDRDGDGITNLVEFALGSNANQAASVGLQSTRLADTNATPGNELVIVAAVRSGAVFTARGNAQSATIDQLTYRVEASTDLSAFDAPVEALALPLSPALTESLPQAPAGWEYRAFRLSGSDGLLGKGFLRIQVSH